MVYSTKIIFFNVLEIFAHTYPFYSLQGFYNQQNCRYLEPNSGRANTEFTVNLDSCGTQFVDDFANGGEAYLENVLVLQNEPGIQEVSAKIYIVKKSKNSLSSPSFHVSVIFVQFHKALPAYAYLITQIINAQS